MITRDYGSWCPVVDRHTVTVEDSIADSFMEVGVSGFDMEGIVSDYRAAINEALPESVSLSGNDFIGPHYEADEDFDGYPTDEDGKLDIRSIVESVDLDAIIKRHHTT